MMKQGVVAAAVAMMAGAVLAAQMEVGVCAYSFRKVTAFEAIEKAKACGADVIELFFWQKLSPEHPNVTLNQHLSDAHIAALKAKLDAVGIKAVNAYVADFGKTEEETRKLFTFAQKLGLRGLTGEPPVDALDRVERMVKETGVQLCFHNHAKNKDKPAYRNWDQRSRSAYGFFGGYWAHLPFGHGSGRLPACARRARAVHAPQGCERGGLWQPGCGVRSGDR